MTADGARLITLEQVDDLLARLPLGGVRRGAFRRRAKSRLAAGEVAEADAVLSRASTVFPRDFGILFDFALVANNRGFFAEALRRWRMALEAAPDRAVCWCGVAANLRSLERIEEARTTIDTALDRFGEEPGVLVEAARVSMVRRDYDAALGFWDRSLASDTPHPDWFFGRADALLRMHRIEDGALALEALRTRAPDHHGLDALARTLQRERRIAINTQPALPRDGTGIAPEVLFAQFESLGDSCEFGLVQRYSHIEPLGLFRFSAVTAEGLTAVVSHRFEDCGTAEDVDLFINDTDGSYDCCSIRYKDFSYHTEVFPGQIEPDALLGRERKKTAYLKMRLMSDMTSPEKIFVRKGGSFARSVEAFRAMRAIGPVTLLWVEVAGEDHLPGTVEKVEDGLLKGYIRRLAPYGNAHDIDMLGWADLCCNALSLWKRQEDARHRFYVTPTLIHRGGLSDGYTSNAPACFISRADLSVRGAWQRIWTSVRLPKAHSFAAVALRITGHEGDTLFLGTWRLESGSLPNPWHLAPPSGPDAVA